MKIFLKPIVSDFQKSNTIDETTAKFNNDLKESLNHLKIELVDEKDADLIIYYIRSGGTENMFKEIFVPQDINLLLTTTMHNSLPAALEIHSYLSDQGLNVEILHGEPDYIAQRIHTFAKIESAKNVLKKDKLGVIGAPSDWLIASYVDYELVNDVFGIEVIDIPIDEFYKVWEEFKIENVTTPYDGDDAIKNYDQNKVVISNRIYKSLKVIIEKYELTAITLRCFDLINEGCGTGCLALSYLNAENIIAGCEGDVAAAISMLIMNRLTDEPMFMSNPSRIDLKENTVLFAHCTLPWNMASKNELDTHFETGTGIGVRGYIEEGDVTVFKLGRDLEQYFISDGSLIDTGNEGVLCRTQVNIKLTEDVKYFLKNTLGNHHLICKGHYAKLIEQYFDNL